MAEGDTVCGVTSAIGTGVDMGKKKDRKRILDEVKKNKIGRTLAEIEDLLALYGFIKRAATKEASVWKRGGVGLTLPNPKSGTLLVDYVVLAVRKIREAEDGEVPEETIS